MINHKNSGLEITAKRGRLFLVLLLTLMAVTMMTAVSAFAGEDTGIDVENTDFTVTPMHNGYCALSFSVPGTTKEVFVTGIREDKAEEIYYKFLNAWQDGKSFKITDESIIDVEKTMDSDSLLLCSPAAGCNLLVYSGWSEMIDPALGLETEDDIFEEIIPEYKNTSDNVRFTGPPIIGGLEWFFSGMVPYMPGIEDVASRCFTNYPYSGGYLSDYDISSVGKNEMIENRQFPLAMNNILNALKEGNAVGLEIVGHALTCWGMVTDMQYSDAEEEHYQALIISDSDNNKSVTGKDRRTLPNTMAVKPIQERKINDRLLSAYIILHPYDGNTGIETNPEATRDRRNDPDLRVYGMNVSADAGPALVPGTRIPEGESNYLNIEIQEYSDVYFDGTITIRATVYRDDEMIVTLEETRSVSLKNRRTTTFSFDLTPEGLVSGDYRAVAEITADPSAQEAFLCNNTAELFFTVTSDPDGGYSGNSIDLTDDNEIASQFVRLTIQYNSADLEMLRKADCAAVSVAHYDQHENPNFEEADVRIFDTPPVPSYITLTKKAEFTRVCVTFCIDGQAYSLYSPEYRYPYADISVALSEDSTDQFSPVPYKGTRFIEGEKISFEIENYSIACDDPFVGEFYLTQDMGSRKPCSSPIRVSIAPGEKISGFYITEWDTPLLKDTDMYLAWREKGANTSDWKNILPIGEIKVQPAPTGGATPTLTPTPTVTLTPTPTVTPTPAYRFSDVTDPKHAYFNAIYWAADAGITKGYPDGTFGIDKPCTRGEMMMFLWRYAGKPNPKNVSKSPFKDVKTNHTFYKAILWGSQKGITKGYSDGTFGINRNVSRGECMMFLWRLKGKPAPKAVAKSPFTDVPKNHVFYNAILWGAQKKITTGYTSGENKGKFMVNANCTRGQIVTFLYRAK